MSTSRIESMFDIYRINNQQDFPKVLLYFPFGFALLLFRLFVVILSWPFLALLPKTSILRSVLLKVVCLIFGIFVKKDTKDQDRKAKLLVCNHISIFDHLAVESVLSCIQVNICSHFCSEWNFPALYTSAERDAGSSEVSRNKLILLQHYINVSEVPALIFPEGSTTNGKYGLLKFRTSPFNITSLVQPVVVQILRTSVIDISPSVIGVSDWCDLLWLMFVPYTVFILRVLPSVSKMDKESSESFSTRVQNIMASSLNLISTEYTSNNKAELEKRLNVLPIAQPEPSDSGQVQRNMPKINKMIEQVKEVLPDVPIPVILQDLKMTKNVDDTISRILEGVVQFVPENNSQVTPSPAETVNSSSSNTEHTDQQALPSLSTAARKFGKTPKDRMQSYQERKLALVNAARMRYLEKHSPL